MKKTIKSEEVVAINSSFATDIRPYIDVIDELRFLGVDQDVKLPTVVVVGDQSSGKSSIIEALSGIQLPRGTGIVTRCPLELQLKRVFTQQWTANLKYKKKSKVTNDQGEVEELIREAQDEICGRNKDVKDELLTLRIEDPRPTAPDLTLIDLPGISRTPVEGQPDDVCNTIRKIVMNHVSNQNAVILCMVSANLDIAVNEALQIAKSVDPQYQRTTGVITKPDLADNQQKTEVMKIIDNKKYKLDKGYVIVKCRSQKELDEELSLEESVTNEMEFFESDPCYSQIDPDKKGIQNLAAKITKELVAVIKKSLPDLKMRIDEELKIARDHMSKVPEGVPSQINDKGIYLTKIVHNICMDFKDFLKNGKANDDFNGFYSWRKEFAKFMETIEKRREKSFYTIFDLRNLHNLIERNRGPEISMFLGFEMFKEQIQTFMKTYIPDAKSLATNIHGNVEERLLGIVDNKFAHMPEINKDFKKMVIEKSRRCHESCNEKIDWIFKQERIIFTMDTLFSEDFNNQVALEEQQNRDQRRNAPRLQPEYLQANSESNAELMQRMLKVYLKIVNKRLCDRIPMTVMHCLMVDLEEDLIASCYEYPTSIIIENKVKENDNIRKEREKWMKKADRLQEAHMKLSVF